MLTAGERPSPAVLIHESRAAITRHHPV